MAPRFFLPLCAAFVGVAGCNLITGASDLEVTGGHGGHGGGTSSHAGGGGAWPGTTTSASSAGGATSSTSTSSTSASASSSTSASASSGGPTCAPACGAHQYCETSTKTCVCDPGYTDQSGACTAAPTGDPTTHTQQQVCDAWKDGHKLTETSPPLTASGADCDPGMLSQAAVTDTLVRLNMFRWMAGLGPTSDDAALDQKAQQCANLEAWWPFTGGSPHSPPATSKCYTPEGGGAAGMSNIAWGSGNPPNAIDQWMQDDGNATTLGHRRWLLNPPLDPIGMGYWQTGGQYGNAACIIVFNGSGTGPKPPWVSMPPPGFVPIGITAWTWSFHGSLGGIGAASITMLRVDDNTPLPVTVQALQPNYAQDATSWTPNGWTAEAGKTYRVTVSGLQGGDVTYDVKPVVCN